MRSLLIGTALLAFGSCAAIADTAAAPSVGTEATAARYVAMAPMMHHRMMMHHKKMMMHHHMMGHHGKMMYHKKMMMRHKMMMHHKMM